jgi:hypothetical protein
MADCKIPLYNRKGRVVGETVVDAEDFARIGHLRWHRADAYASGYIDGVLTLMHRAILGAPPFEQASVDHLNGDGLDNRRANLRWLTKAQNRHNVRVRRDSASGVLGVSFDRRAQRWVGRVRVGKRQVFLKYFKDKTEASAAVVAARTRIFPAFVADRKVSA